MRVLLLAPGNSIHSQRLVEMLLATGHSVTFVDGNNPLSGNHAGYEFIKLNEIRGIHRLGEAGALSAEAWLRVPQLRMIWQRVRPDVVNVHWVNDRAWSCARAGLRPLVLSCWGSDINHLFAPLGSDTHLLEAPENKNNSYRKRIAFAVRSADCLTADSQEVLDRCEQLAGRDIANCLWYFGVNTDQFKPGYFHESEALRAKLNIPPDCKVILSSRRLFPLLGQSRILEAFADVAHDPKMPDAVLVFRRYFALYELERDLRMEAEKLGVTHKIRWLDGASNDEVPIHYAMADVVVNYPERDAFPVSLLEAAASKRPVISADLRAYEGVFTGSFMMVPPNDARALAKGLKAFFMEEPDQISKRVERAYSIVNSVGTQMKSVEKITDIFEKVIRSRNKGLPKLSLTRSSA